MAFSMESYLYVALILAAMDAYVADRPALAGILAGLTALVRGDGALLGASMLTYDVIPAIWYLFALGYYGSPFPATLAAKTAQGEFNWLRLNFIQGLEHYLSEWTQEGERVVYFLFPALMGLGLLRGLWTERPWLILVGRDLLYLAAFSALNVPTAEWYYAPLMPGAALLTARGIQLVAEMVAGLIPRPRRAVIAGGVAAPLPADRCHCPGPSRLEGPGLSAHRPLDCPTYQCYGQFGHNRHRSPGLLVWTAYHRYRWPGPAGCSRAHCRG